MSGQSADREGQHKQRSEKVTERDRRKRKVKRAVHGKERGGVFGQAADGDGHQHKQHVGNGGGGRGRWRGTGRATGVKKRGKSEREMDRKEERGPGTDEEDKGNDEEDDGEDEEDNKQELVQCMYCNTIGPARVVCAKCSDHSSSFFIPMI